jgi:hypothetical protein
LVRGALRAHLLKSPIANRKSKMNGGKGIRTPDFQLAKLALYQLSYAPVGEGLILDCRLPIANLQRKCSAASEHKQRPANKMPDGNLTIHQPAFRCFFLRKAVYFASVIALYQARPNTPFSHHLHRSLCP